MFEEGGGTCLDIGGRIRLPHVAKSLLRAQALGFRVLGLGFRVSRSQQLGTVWRMTVFACMYVSAGRW